MQIQVDVIDDAMEFLGYVNISEKKYIYDQGP